MLVSLTFPIENIPYIDKQGDALRALLLYGLDIIAC